MASHYGGTHFAAAPTLADVAERAGVSRQTVSNAINNPELLRADTLERVQTAIADLDYRPNRAARNLRTRASHLIGMRFAPAQEGTANAAMDRFVHSLVEACKAAGYHVLLFAGDHRDPVAGYDALMRSTAVDAFVVTDTYLGNPQAAALDERGAPFVAFGRPWEGDSRHPWVDVDGAAGTTLATEHLAERGHTRIAWLGWDESSWIGEDRRHGWERTMQRRGLDPTGLAARVDDTLEDAVRGARMLLDAEHPPTGIVCASDTLAMGVLHALAERGLAPGRDVAVVGFDDSQVAQVAPPGLTSVRQPLEEVAVEVVKGAPGPADPAGRPGDGSPVGAHALHPRHHLTPLRTGATTRSRRTPPRCPRAPPAPARPWPSAVRAAPPSQIGA